MLVKSVNFLPPSIKSMNPIQKYPHITELFACTRKILAIMFLFPANSLISSGTCSTPKHRNKQFHFCHKIKQSNVCLYPRIYQILVHFHNTFMFQN